MKTIACIGLGIMGRPITLNLMRAEYPVRVWARRAEAMQPLVEAGAVATDSGAAAARGADIIFTNVSDTSDVEQVILGPEGIAEGAAVGSVVVDMSTISPSATRRIAERLAERGVDMLDAPVSGGEQGAIDGRLSIMVGGKAGVFERVLPVFEVLGRNIVHIGAHGAGQVTKACNQAVAAQTINAIGEALVFAKAADVDPSRVRDALLEWLRRKPYPGAPRRPHAGPRFQARFQGETAPKGHAHRAGGRARAGHRASRRGARRAVD